MSLPVRLGLFALALVLAFAAAFAVGRATDPVPSEAASGSSSAHGAGHGDGHSGAKTAGLPEGLQVSADGYRFAPQVSVLPADRRTRLRFTIQRADGSPVTEYVRTHEKNLHLIVVRRDLTGYRHVHPRMSASGVWSVPLTLRDAGSYRALADFHPRGAGAPMTLGVDLAVPGTFTPEALPPPTTTATVDGYDVGVRGDLVAGRAAEVTFQVSKGGLPVTDLEPYLGANGHLVALRAGDLAYLHVHPTQQADEVPGEIGFAVELPSAGPHRLFLDFRHRGVVRTAEFTVTVPPAVGGHAGHGGHGDLGGHGDHGGNGGDSFL